MGRLIVTVLSGAPKSSVEQYYQQQDLENKPYKWTEISNILEQYKNKTEDIDNERKLLNLFVV